MFSSLLPARCLLCHADVRQSTVCLCTDCLQDLPFLENACCQCGQSLSATTAYSLCGSCQTHTPYIDQTFSLLHYRPPVDYLIKQLKFHHALMVATLFGNLLAEQISARNLPLPDVMVPIPLHRKRLRERGYNQALEIAKPLARILGIPLQTTLLVRTQHTLPQTECTIQERRKNVRNRFHCPDPANYKSIAVIDDVITTGSTANEAAKAFKQQGIQQVSIWSCAHTPLS